jgi:hypothetical protein
MGEGNTQSIIPFSEATRIERLDSHVYRANLIDSFCIGTGEITIHLITLPRSLI